MGSTIGVSVRRQRHLRPHHRHRYRSHRLPDLGDLFRAAANLRSRVSAGDKTVFKSCQRNVMATLFFEASTRTDMSFQAAMIRLGGEVIATSGGVQFSSVYKGENLADTVRAAGAYADVIVLRHPEVRSSIEAAYHLDQLAGRLGTAPVVISAGDGVGEHPTQALLDLFTIIDRQHREDELTITLVGDLANGRTVHSLAKLLALYGAQARLIFVSPDELKAPRQVLDFVRLRGLEVVEAGTLDGVIQWDSIAPALGDGGVSMVVPTSTGSCSEGAIDFRPSAPRQDASRPYDVGLRHRVGHAIVASTLAGEPVAVGFGGYRHETTEVATALRTSLAGQIVDVRLAGRASTTSCSCWQASPAWVIEIIGISDRIDALEGTLGGRLDALGSTEEFEDRHHEHWIAAGEIVDAAFESGRIDRAAARLHDLGRIVVDPDDGPDPRPDDPAEPVER